MSQSQVALSSTPNVGLIRYAVGNTLLPQHVAELITNLSLVARVSLRATAFFLEVILEAVKMSTGTGLGLTRRALISAIGAARTMQALTGDPPNPAFEPDSLEKDTTGLAGANNAIFALLDKYTAVGIYVVHHGLTMTELLAMSGITLVQNSLRTGLSAAEASVQLLDGVFGSNETSRALASFIELVRREFTARDGTSGGVKAMAGLTRAITTFAIVQAATHRRTAKTHKMRVLYDCTVLGETDTTSWKASILGPTSFRPAEAEQRRPPIAQPPPRSPSILESELAKSRSFYAGTRDSQLFTTALSDPHHFPTSPSIAQSLDYFCGDDDIEGPELPNAASNQSGNRRLPRTVTISRLQADDELTSDVKAKLQKCSQEDLQRGVIIDRQKLDSDGGREVRQLVRKADAEGLPPFNSGDQTIWEIITETTEITETIEEHEQCDVDESSSASMTHPQHPSPARPRIAKRQPSLALKLRPRIPFRLFSGSAAAAKDNHSTTETETGRDSSHMARGFESERRNTDGGYEQVVEDEQEWQEVSRTLSKARLFDGEHRLLDGLPSGAIPSAENGSPAQPPALSRIDALQDPSESTQRMRLVLKRVRKKLIKTTRVVASREVVASSRQGTPETTESSASSSMRPTTPSDLLRELVRPDHGKTSLQRALTRNKPSITPNALNLASHSAHTPSTAVGAHNDKLQSHSPAIPSREDSLGGPVSPAKQRRSRALSQTSVRSYASRRHRRSSMRATARHGPGLADHPTFPTGDLIDNLQRFMRYASACYGHNFMNILGIGDPYQFRNTKQKHANVWAFAQHVGVPFDDVLLSSFSQETDGTFHSRSMTPIVNYITIDREKKAVVLACRGTLGLSDILVDLTCEYEHVKLACGEGKVHMGIFNSAANLAAPRGTVVSTIARALESNPDYGLVVVGHSLGGGVAACLALLWGCPLQAYRERCEGTVNIPTAPFVTGFDLGLPAGRPIRSYAYGPPAIADSDLASAVRELITSVVHNNDVVPCLSIGTVRDFKQIAEVLETSVGESCSEILGRTIGLYQGKQDGSYVGEATDVPLLEHKGIFPIEVADEERCLTVDRGEAMKGKTRNRATDAGYVDPNQRDHSQKPSGSKRRSMSDDSHRHTGRSKAEDLEDWLWSLIKTMRAHAQSEKLYPVGVVLCLESFEVYVRRETTAEERDRRHGSHTDEQTTSTASAQRVILRECEDVPGRFGEPVFCRTLFRDHSPAGYEFCLDLLKRAQE